MSTHSNKEIKEDLPTLLHLRLHGGTLLEIISIPDDDGEIMTSQSRLRVRCMFVCPAS